MHHWAVGRKSMRADANTGRWHAYVRRPEFGSGRYGPGDARYAGEREPQPHDQFACFVPHGRTPIGGRERISK